MRHISRTLHLTLAVLLVSLSMQAQDVAGYKRIVKQLSSPKFEGRGYVNDGALKAGDYLAEQYRKAGADEVTLQPFTIDINTFPGKAKMSVDGRRLKPGDDFTMREYSPGVHGTYPLYYIDTLNYDFRKITEDLAKPEYKDCMVVCDFWFIYRHKADFRKMERSADYANTGMIYTWEEPLKFYKAYGEKVYEKPVIWWGPGYPKDARSVTVDIDNEFRPDCPCKNVIAKVEGRRHDSTIVFIAHYDHLGHLGKKLYFPGVNDNASGNAALVTLAAYYAKNRPEFDMLFISVAGEEANLRGSQYFVNNPTVPLESIKYLINLDMIGDDNPVQYCEVSDAGMAGFVLFERLNGENGWFTALNRGDLAANSDHYPFAVKGVPCIFLENKEGSTFPYYHTAHDDRSRLVWSTYEKVFRMVVKFIGEY